MRDRKRAVLGLLGGAALAALVLLGVYLKGVADYRQAVRALSFEEVELSAVPDGVYTGSCDVGMISARVEVTVEGGRIAAITLLEHRQERGQPAEAVLEEILRQQRIDVDTVSGATNSSKVLKKAVEDALKSGLLSPAGA